MMTKKHVVIVCWAMLLGLVIICYWSGLYGGFVFDDDVNILKNSSLQIQSGNWDEIWAAAVSGHAGPLGRPIALASFALNYYWAGAFDPFQFKIFNLGIHILNAVLVGCFAQTVCRVINSNEGRPTFQAALWMGWVVAALWALHPLNLTAVLYVVQRMTSLSTLFGLMALVIFCEYRSATYLAHGMRYPFLQMGVGSLLVSVCLLLSVLTKESGALFLPLIFWTELLVFRFRYHGAPARIGKWHLRTFALWIVALCLVYVCFKIPSMVSPASYANREFTMLERVLTEARVLVFYLQMLVFPVSSKMSLYHDDFEISHSLLSPASTLAAIVFLLIISVGTWLLRRKFNVLIFGWGWFLISHALESTIFPLELVYEHRNYFAMIGILMLVPSIMQRVDMRKYGCIVWLLLLLSLCLLGFITHVRSLQWSNNADWAALEAANKPSSMRANYELGRTYVVLLQASGNADFGPLAKTALARSSDNDPSAVLPLVARVQLAYMLEETPSLELVAQMKRAFGNEIHRNVNTAVLASLINCQIAQKCRMEDEDALDVLSLAFHNPYTPISERAEILKLAAQYQINRLNSLSTGIDLIRQAIATHDTVASRIMYAQALFMAGDKRAGLLELQSAEAMDQKKEYALVIARERNNIKKVFSEP